MRRRYYDARISVTRNKRLKGNLDSTGDFYAKQLIDLDKELREKTFKLLKELYGMVREQFWKSSDKMPNVEDITYRTFYDALESTNIRQKVKGKLRVMNDYSGGDSLQGVINDPSEMMDMRLDDRQFKLGDELRDLERYFRR